MEATWGLWRQGRHPDRFGRPLRRYFLARAGLPRFQELASKARQPLIPTGITVLEERAGLAPTGAIREVAFLTTAQGLETLAEHMGLQLSERRETPAASEITVLDPRHPIFNICDLRRQSDRDAWPLGLAALDAVDHPNARVAGLARESWRTWIDEIQTINLDTLGR